MLREPANFTDLAAQFEALGAADRKAVLAKMSAEDRDAYCAAAAHQATGRKEEADRLRKADRQYAPYSQWLGEIIENAAKRDAQVDDKITETAIRAIGEAHEKLREEGPPLQPVLWDRIQRLILGPLPPAATKTEHRTGPSVRPASERPR